MFVVVFFVSILVVFELLRRFFGKRFYMLVCNMVMNDKV